MSFIHLIARNVEQLKETQMNSQEFVETIRKLHSEHSCECSDFFNGIRSKISKQIVDDFEAEDINKLMFEMTLLFCCGELAKMLSILVPDQRENILDSCNKFIKEMLEEHDEGLAVEDSN